MDPIPFGGTGADMAEHIKKVVLAMPRTELKKQEGNYLHFTFKSRIFGFVDDVEFEIDESAGVVNFRSALPNRLLGYGSQSQAHGPGFPKN